MFARFTSSSLSIYEIASPITTCVCIKKMLTKNSAHPDVLIESHKLLPSHRFHLNMDVIRTAVFFCLRNDNILIENGNDFFLIIKC